MDIFFVLLLIAVVAIVIIAMTSGEPGDDRLPVAGSPARLTLEEVGRINQLAHLQHLQLDLTVKLAARLNGDAWQLAQSGICPALLMAGREAQALELLAQLDEHHRQSALHGMLNNLIEANEEPRALALLAQLELDLPENPLQRIALLHASGKQEEAERELHALAQQYPPADGDSAVLALLALARLQHRLGKSDSAIQTLDQTWQEMQRGAAEQDYLGLEQLATQLAQLGQFQTLQDLAGQLPNTRHTALIAELTQAGLFEQARLLIQGLEPLSQSVAYETLLEAMLERGQLRLATELLAASEDMGRTQLLLCMAQSYLRHNDMAGLTAFIETQVADRAERSRLYLSLWHLHQQQQPQHAAALLELAERWNAAHEDGLFDLLEARLTLQSQLPPRERTSYEIRRGVDDMTRLARDEDCYFSANYLIRLARLLARLERKADALERLAEARQLMRDKASELDELDVELLLEDLASAYLALDELDLARATRNERLQHAPAGRDDWTVELIRHGHLELAIDNLSFYDLYNGEQPLHLLDARIQELTEQAPERSQTLQEWLLARLESPTFWQLTQAN